jgi:hypothetical protein
MSTSTRDPETRDAPPRRIDKAQYALAAFLAVVGAT